MLLSMRGLLAASLVLCATSVAETASAKKTLADYRYFRALSVDLSGRIPTRAEVAEFEADTFDVDKWIDAHLASDTYAERVRRIYMDALRLQIGRTFQFVPTSTTLRRQKVLLEGGKEVWVYFRQGQRRKREETDGEFCLTQAETGQQYPRFTAGTGTAKPVPLTTLDANTVAVKPWWLYRDYRSSAPKDLYDAATWATKYPNHIPANELLTEPDGKTAATEIRICKEEAATAPTGTIYVTGRKAPATGTAPPHGRLSQLPLDSAYAKANPGATVSCTSSTAIMNTTDCGCGPGLERCMPGGSSSFDPTAFVLPRQIPLGVEDATDTGSEPQSSYSRLWWGEEASRFLDQIFSEDRDFREVVTGKWTMVNGPLTQFYKASAPATCCGNGYDFGYAQPDPLVDPSKLPDLLPHDTGKWAKVEDRGAYAAGILTMPVFLTKYGSRRARAHVLYQAFQCKQFVAGDVKLTPSTEPDLTKRPGCNTCHVVLEPMSAYFSRIQESDWTWLPESKFPIESTKCKSADPTKMSFTCKSYYDPAFVDGTRALLRGAYSSAANANAGPAALGQQIAKSDTFAQCVVQKVSESFLGRSLSTDDVTLQKDLADSFGKGGFKMRTLVRALVKADAYKNANNLTSSAWRKEGK